MSYFIWNIISTVSNGAVYSDGFAITKADGTIPDYNGLCIGTFSTRFPINMGSVDSLSCFADDVEIQILDDTDMSIETLSQAQLAKILHKGVKVNGVRFYKGADDRYVFAKCTIMHTALENHIKFIRKEDFFTSTNRFNPNFIRDCNYEFGKNNDSILNVALADVMYTIYSKGKWSSNNLITKRSDNPASGYIARNGIAMPWTGGKFCVANIVSSVNGDVSNYIEANRAWNTYMDLFKVVPQNAKNLGVFDAFLIYCNFGDTLSIGLHMGEEKDVFVIDTPFARYYYKIDHKIIKSIITYRLLGNRTF